ncbi:50S ribosomal protein-like protein [Quillaja saponaria]|uniref:50S ribosomal protein-like protein n=1 Tax=Quillaja saponaria TaxID=32244 RepID=A0AAD7L9R1_QUISA|nr:50S ribosomal protein-like protein [Quillaja saponaria]
MLLSRSTSRRSPRLQDMPYQQITPTSLPKVIKKDSTQRNSLKDLFVSSPPPMEEGPDEMDKKIVRGQTAGSVGNVSPDGSVYSRVGPASPRPVWLGFRSRSLLRRAWRPVLVSISE